MATLTTESGQEITQVTPAASARIQATARIEDSQQAAAQPDAPPKRAPAADTPKRRGRPPKTEQARAAAVVPLTDLQRGDGVKGLAQVGAGLCLMASKATGSDAFRADAIVIASRADAIAQACVQTAKADARFAAALDKVCAAGPYAALVSVGVGLVSQLARNHRPALSIPGTADPADILRAAEQDAEEAETGDGAPAAA